MFTFIPNEDEDFYEIHLSKWDPRWCNFSKKVDKLRRMRAKIKSDLNAKNTQDIPTSFELEQWVLL